jgi:hypothetical protein
MYDLELGVRSRVGLLPLIHFSHLLLFKLVDLNLLHQMILNLLLQLCLLHSECIVASLELLILPGHILVAYRCGPGRLRPLECRTLIQVARLQQMFPACQLR